jgi:hypothetical protein
MQREFPSASNIRTRVFDHLRLVAAPHLQWKLERNVPEADVPAELVAVWFDDAYRPKWGEFRRAFDATEFEALERFNERFDAVADALPDTLIELQHDPKWREVELAAAEALTAMGLDVPPDRERVSPFAPDLVDLADLLELASPHLPTSGKGMALGAGPEALTLVDRDLDLRLLDPDERVLIEIYERANVRQLDALEFQSAFFERIDGDPKVDVALLSPRLYGMSRGSFIEFWPRFVRPLKPGALLLARVPIEAEGARATYDEERLERHWAPFEFVHRQEREGDGWRAFDVVARKASDATPVMEKEEPAQERQERSESRPPQRRFTPRPPPPRRPMRGGPRRRP